MYKLRSEHFAHQPKECLFGLAQIQWIQLAEGVLVFLSMLTDTGR